MYQISWYFHFGIYIQIPKLIIMDDEIPPTWGMIYVYWYNSLSRNERIRCWALNNFWPIQKYLKSKKLELCIFFLKFWFSETDRATTLPEPVSWRNQSSWIVETALLFSLANVSTITSTATPAVWKLLLIRSARSVYFQVISSPIVFHAAE